MAEQEEKGPLEKPIDWFSGWKTSFERVRQRFGMPVAILLGLSVAGGMVWWNWDEIAKRPGIEWVLAWFHQKALPIAPVGRLTIAVAHLDNDKDRVATVSRVGIPRASRPSIAQWTLNSRTRK
jgi:hypothetical protein